MLGCKLGSGSFQHRFRSSSVSPHLPLWNKGLFRIIFANFWNSSHSVTLPAIDDSFNVEHGKDFEDVSFQNFIHAWAKEELVEDSVHDPRTIRLTRMNS